ARRSLMTTRRHRLVLLLFVLSPLGVEAQAPPRTDVHGDPLPADAVARLGSVRFRHPDGIVSSLAFSPDGKTLAVSGSYFSNSDIRVWDVAAGRELRRLSDKVHGQGLLAFSPDGRLLAVGHVSGLQVWDLATGRMLHKADMTSSRQLCALAFAPD